MVRFLLSEVFQNSITKYEPCAETRQSLFSTNANATNSPPPCEEGNSNLGCCEMAIEMAISGIRGTFAVCVFCVQKIKQKHEKNLKERKASRMAK